MNNQNDLEIEEILDFIMSEETAPSYEALQRWCKRYPSHQRELSAFFATWACQLEQKVTAEVDETSLANRMVSRALQLMDQIPAVETAGVFGDRRLLKVANERGFNIQDLAKECGVDDSVILKLDRCLLALDSIPEIFIRGVARAIPCSMGELQQYLMKPLKAASQHKAKRKPRTHPESFLEAIEGSDLPDADKVRWREIIANDAAIGRDLP